MDRFDQLIEEWVREQYIPGGVLSVTVHNRLQFQKAYGSYSDGQSQRPIRLNTLFDLASLTKVVSTLPAVLNLAAHGKLGLDDPVQKYFPGFLYNGITIRHLLLHNSGLPADLPYRSRSTEGRKVLADLLKQPIVSPVGSKVTYSDLGFIMLGEIVAHVSGEPLDRFVRRNVFEPLGMTDVCFNPGEKLIERTAATEFVEGAYIKGRVHDEKAWHLGGVSGSAGLFGTAGELAKYAAYWLHPGNVPLLPPSLLREALQSPFQNRGLGWEVWDDPETIPASCGALWSRGSFGHTGFTGTSLWIDPHRELIVVFLTNAVHFGRNHPLRHLRRKLHDEIYAALFMSGAE